MKWPNKAQKVHFPENIRKSHMLVSSKLFCSEDRSELATLLKKNFITSIVQEFSSHSHKIIFEIAMPYLLVY